MPTNVTFTDNNSMTRSSEWFLPRKGALLALLLHCPFLYCVGQGLSSTSFSRRIHELGLQRPSRDYSLASSFSIPEPSCAYVNITGATRMPEYKGDEQRCWMEVYDGNGNYFRKRVLLDAQGNASLSFPKKNAKVDFFEDNWLGEETTSITVGDWVAQDGFHIKAYYTDYFRGLAVVGYRLYELMARDAGRAWERSGGLAKDEPRALCHPDGFPCVVYLNGEFYGIYSWQLKKHRANMAQRKGEARHIHLDGRLSNETLWDGDIDWTAFEVRNPKTLTDETRQRILSLSQVCGDLQHMKTEGRSETELRAEFSRRFDVRSLIDYACLHYLTANYDGFAKNWQWFTYDGVRWFVAPYDLDCTFGNVDTGDVLMSPDQTGLDPYWVLYPEGPMQWLARYFMDDIKERYCLLRGNNVIGRETVKELARDWYERIGERNYAEEWMRWKDSKCIRKPEYAWCWKPVEVWVNYHNLPYWDDATEYKAGDVCRLDMCEWVATTANTGIKPYVRLGYVDSMERLEEWIDTRFELIDSYMGYMEDVSIQAPAKEECEGSGYIGIYDLQGRKVTSPQKNGLFIKNGKKFVVKKCR